VLPLSEPSFGGNEWRYIKECLDSGWVSSVGPFVENFEKVIADYVGAGHAVATVNGTAALHVALLIAGVKPEDEVLVPALTFIAPANAVRYCRAHPVFLDVDPRTGNLDPDALDTFLREECRSGDGPPIHRRTGRRVSTVLPVHLYGHPADMDAIGALAKRYGLAVVEDGAESLGAVARGKRLGCSSDLLCFSFNGNKVITTGGGGMIVTRHAGLARRARHLTTQAKADKTEYRHDEIGFNYRMPSINAALGLAQLEQLDGFLKRKRIIAEIYQKELGSLNGLRVCGETEWAASSYWLVNIFVDEAEAGISSRTLQTRLEAHGIASRPLWYPLHRQPAYTSCHAYRVETADRLWAQGLSLPSSPQLTDSQALMVCAAVREALQD